MSHPIEVLEALAEELPVRTVGDAGTDLHEVLTQAGSEGIYQLLKGNNTPSYLPAPIGQEEPQTNTDTHPSAIDHKHPTIETIHSGKIAIPFPNNTYYVLGAIGQDLSSLTVTLMVEDAVTGRKQRLKTDLYDRYAIQSLISEISDAFGQDEDTIGEEVSQLTDALENYREKQLADLLQPNTRQARKTTFPGGRQQYIDFLKHPHLIEEINTLIGQAGVVGEETTRKLLFIIATTYKMPHPLHALVQGSSGSGKSHLLNTISSCLPQEDVISMTRVTSKSFYHYGNDELVNKLMLIQDYDGLDEEAQYAFRELQSAGTITSSTTFKDRHGNLHSKVKTVKSHFASFLATTKAEVYYDHLSRSVMVGIDESDEQTLRILQHQNEKLAGNTDPKAEQRVRAFLQNAVRCLEPREVINPYAGKVMLPFEAKMLRRLNHHYQAFVKQVTLLHQYQREKDEQGRLVATPQDLQLACDIFFDAIMLKVDELDSSLRQFFDRMKEFVSSQAKQHPRNNRKSGSDYQFTQRDVRIALNTSKTSCFRYMEDLEQLEYIERCGGYSNRGFKYRIVYWDDMEKTRQKIKEQLHRQLQQL